ncbi:Hypothetical protein, putative [Bodo saltans]|uniref:Uncharacterized protein n=1 Tax=Bodo saltans TaxID=75058 RepID=A0A0S4JFZ8_BODSA|nr:Hypothetical protein, putative [Bodo saltans]|eukprot:CUG88118.1 Hypothetical protein, putative [Bodo saltans]
MPQQQQMRRTVSGRAALVQSTVSVFSDHQQSAGAFEHPVPASSGGQFWQRRGGGGGGAGARRSRTSPSSSHGHKRTASKEDITFPLYVYANIQTAKKAESGEEEEDDDEYGGDAAPGAATETTPDIAKEAATSSLPQFTEVPRRLSAEEVDAMTTAARASASRHHRPPLPIISPGFASPLAPGTSASAASYPTSTPVENALILADDAASPMPHPPPPPPPPPPPVSIAEGSSHHSRLHHAEPHSTTLVGSGAPVWHNRLQVNAVATSLSFQRSSTWGTWRRESIGAVSSKLCA